MELTLLGTAFVAAFLLGGGAVMLVVSFRRTIQLRGALIQALRRIESLERSVAEGLPLQASIVAPAVTAQDAPRPLAAPRPAVTFEPTLDELAAEVEAADKIDPPRIGILAFVAPLATVALLAAAQAGMLAGQASVLLALAVGVLVVAAAEWRRRADPSPSGWRDEAALSALLGFAIMLAGVLYGRWVLGALHPPAAFFTAASLTLIAAALAAWFGPLLLAFALLAAPVIVNLAPIGADGSWGHYAFLFAITAILLSQARRRGEAIWAWLALAHGLFWGANAAFIGGGPDTITIAGLYLAGLVALGAVHAWDEPAKALAFPPWAAPAREALLTAYAVSIIAGASLALLVITHPTPTPNAAAGIIALCAFAIAAGAARQQLWLLPIIAAAAASTAIALWPAGATAIATDAPGLVLLAAGLGLLFSLGGWASMQARDTRPGAYVAALAPVVVFAAAFARVGAFGAPHVWAGAALLLAVINALCHLQLRRAKPEAAYAFAAGAALAAAASLTAIMPAPYAPLALAAIAPLIAAADRWRDEPGLRLAALLVGVALLARLLAPEVFVATATDSAGLAVLFLPSAAALLLAAFIFALGPAGRDGPVTQLMAVLALLIMAACAMLVARHAFTGGDIGAPYASLVEAGINTLVLLGLAALIAWSPGVQPTPLARFVGLLTFGAAITHAALVGGLLINPWWGLAPADVPGWRGFNAIELAFAAPGLGFLGYAALRARQGFAGYANAALFAGLTLLFFALILELRRLFHGADMAAAAITYAEAWAYSGAMLGFAALMLALFAEHGGRALRYASLALALLALAKMAFGDLVAIGGVARVVAFLTIAAAAGGIVFFFRRFVLPADPAQPKTEADPNLVPPG